MAIVTYTLTDFALVSLASKQVQVVFKPSGPAVKNYRLLATAPIVSIPTTFGVGEADLAITTELVPDAWFEIEVRWQEPGSPVSQGYSVADFPDWKLRVPEAGGTLGDLLATPPNPTLGWVGTDPPPMSSGNMIWLNPTTGDLKKWV